MVKANGFVILHYSVHNKENSQFQSASFFVFLCLNLHLRRMTIIYFFKRVMQKWAISKQRYSATNFFILLKELRKIYSCTTRRFFPKQGFRWTRTIFFIEILWKTTQINSYLNVIKFWETDIFSQAVLAKIW